MNIKDRLIEVVRTLRKHKVRFALAGGVVASAYRETERFTKDLDFLLFSEINSSEKASEILKELGLNPHVVTDADLAGGPLFKIKNRSGTPQIIVGRRGGDSTQIGVDFLLPTMPWFEPALERAEMHMIDFGSDKIPCLTPEDLIMAKLYALKNTGKRPNDLDDVEQILNACKEIDYDYLAGQMRRLELALPKSLFASAPDALVKVSKGIEREQRKRVKRNKKPFP